MSRSSIYIALGATALLAALLLAALAGLVANLAHTPMASNSSTYVVSRGVSFVELAEDLEDKKLVSSAALLRIYHWWRGSEGAIQAGEYAIRAGMLPRDFLDSIEQGRAIHHTFSIIPGTTTAQALAKLRSLDTIAHELPGDTTAENLMSFISDGKYKSYHAEGMFYADTYHFHRGTTDIALLRKAHRHLLAKLDERCPSLPPELSSAYEALTLASIVEKEAGSRSEYATIAAVFLNRLRRNMRLEADPTVIYGLGDSYQGDIKTSHLRTPTRYNTYTFRGLTPTPIANVWQNSLQSVCSPAQHDYLFFVADGTGGHVFTTNYDDHRKAVREYVRFQKERQ